MTGTESGTRSGGKDSRARGLLQAVDVLAGAVNAVVLVGGGAGILRGHQGGGVSAGEERVLGVGRSDDLPRRVVLLLSFAFLFLPPLWMEVRVQRN